RRRRARPAAGTQPGAGHRPGPGHPRSPPGAATGSDPGTDPGKIAAPHRGLSARRAGGQPGTLRTGLRAGHAGRRAAHAADALAAARLAGDPGPHLRLVAVEARWRVASV